jgi:glyoxylase-like metal-dependent hydrolase (beta-lactamase superfamily II)
MNIEKDLFCYPWENPLENNCNSYVIGGDVTVLIDVGHLRHLGRLLASAESKALVAMHREEERYLKDHGETLYQMMGITSPRSRADFYLREGNLKLGKVDLQVYHTPGHSPGSLCFYWPKKKVLISGDVVFRGGVGRTDLPGGDGNQLKHSIQRLSQLDIEVLLPGHGEIITGKQSVLRNFNLIRETYFPML